MTNDELKAHFIYEPQTGMLRKIKNARKPYPWRKTAESYLRTSFHRKTYYLHRLVWQWFHGVAPDMIDHIAGDASNNRIENLRSCTNAQNQYNRKRNAGNQSGVKGVVFHRGTHNLKRPWHARIMRNGRTISLGYFASKEEAAEAYRKGALRVAGEFARAD